MILYVGRHGISSRAVTRPGADAIAGIGDQVLNGVYARLSTFRHAVNFADRHRVVTLAPDHMEPGPATITLRSFDPEQFGAVVRVGDAFLQIGGVAYTIAGVPVYDSSLDLAAEMPASFASRLALLRNRVTDRAPSNSLAFLLNPHAARLTRPSFEQRFAERMTAAARLFRECLPHGRPVRQLREAIGLMAGAGFGLTPSGNDFIAGALLALHIHERLTGIDHAGVRQTIFHAAHTSDLLSMHFLNLAYQGSFHAPLKDVARALCAGDAEWLEPAADRALAMGDTSGADLLSGCIATLEICMGVHL